MLLPVTLSCDKNNPNGNIRAYFKKVRCDTATFGHLALIVLLWICPNSKKETKYETVHERNSFNKEIGKLVKDFVLIDTNSPSFSAKTVARFKTNQWRKNGVSAPRETMGGKFRVNINFLPILIPTTVVSEKQGPLVVYFLSYRQLKTFWELRRDILLIDRVGGPHGRNIWPEVMTYGPSAARPASLGVMAESQIFSRPRLTKLSQ